MRTCPPTWSAIRASFSFPKTEKKRTKKTNYRRFSLSVFDEDAIEKRSITDFDRQGALVRIRMQASPWNVVLKPPRVTPPLSSSPVFGSLSALLLARQFVIPPSLTSSIFETEPQWRPLKKRASFAAKWSPSFHQMTPTKQRKGKKKSAVCYSIPLFPLTSSNEEIRGKFGKERKLNVSIRRGGDSREGQHRRSTRTERYIYTPWLNLRDTATKSDVKIGSLAQHEKKKNWPTAFTEEKESPLILCCLVHRHTPLYAYTTIYR